MKVTKLSIHDANLIRIVRDNSSAVDKPGEKQLEWTTVSFMAGGEHFEVTVFGEPAVEAYGIIPESAVYLAVRALEMLNRVAEGPPLSAADDSELEEMNAELEEYRTHQCPECGKSVHNEQAAYCTRACAAKSVAGERTALTVVGGDE